MRQGLSRFIVDALAGTRYRPDGSVEREFAPAVWTLAHRGYSGCGRLDVWAYPCERAAQRAGAVLAIDCGLSDDAPDAQALFTAGQYAAVMALYERHRPADHLLRVQAAWLCDEDDPSQF